jgi:hypothetical protein
MGRFSGVFRSITGPETKAYEAGGALGERFPHLSIERHPISLSRITSMALALERAVPQQTGEVDCGSAPFDFDNKNDLNFFVRAVTSEGEQRIYWGKDLPRALEEAGAKVGHSITATRVASKPVTVEEIQEQPDGSKQTVRIDAKHNSWQVDNHGVNRLALTRAYDTLVKTPEDRKNLEISAPLLVGARDKDIVELSARNWRPS